jgi:hypothetical protein
VRESDGGGATAWGKTQEDAWRQNEGKDGKVHKQHDIHLNTRLFFSDTFFVLCYFKN